MAEQKAAKKKSKKKKEEAKEKGAAPEAPPVATVPVPQAVPYVEPGTPEFTMPAQVTHEVLAQYMRPLSFDEVRKDLQKKVEFLKAAGLACPDALYLDVTNALIWLQTADIGQVVKEYVRIMEILRFWRTYSEEQERDTEQKRKFYQRQLVTNVRANWNTEVDGKMTIDAADAKVRSDPEHDKWLGYQRTWEFLGKQIYQIIQSMQTEMLVQASVWTQHELGMRAQVPHGAVG